MYIHSMIDRSIEQLKPKQHFVEVKVSNQWGNSVYTNVTVTMPEFSKTDLNKDGIVNIQDIAIVAAAFGTRPGDEKWDLIADLAEPYGEINIVDVSIVAKDYGRTA